MFVGERFVVSPLQVTALNSKPLCRPEACDADSILIVVPMEQIGVRLDGEDVPKKTGLDGLQVIFPEDCSFLLLRRVCCFFGGVVLFGGLRR